LDCYVYCFCEVPGFQIQHTVGMEGSPVRQIEHDGIIAVTTDCSVNLARSAQNLVAHNQMINSLLRFTTPIPCRFGTILSRRDLEVYIESNRPALGSLLEKFTGCVEMGLRIAWNPKDASGQIGPDIEARPAEVVPASEGPGTRFLAEKLRQAASQESFERLAQGILDWADSRFGATVKDTAARLRHQAGMTADIAHLVERTRLEQYRESFRAAADERTDLRLSSSGAWAPYSFAVVDAGTSHFQG
jgi:hypothetical protein